MYELAALGFGPFFERQLESSGGDDTVVARIAAEHRGAYEVWSTAGSGRAQLAGRLRRELESYRKLEREAQANELRHDEHRRRQAERVWGQLHDEVAQLRKWKGGKP